jgi:regulatory protein
MMKIEQIASQPDRAGRHAVRFDDGSTMRLYRQTIEDFGLYAGLEQTEEEFSRLTEAAGQMSAKMRAVRIISASGVTKRELEHRLIQKGEDPVQAKEAVSWLSEMDLIDDAKTARQIVERCIAKGYGLARAKQALYEKRVPKHLWEDALADYPPQDEHILSYLENPPEIRQDRKARDRVINALLRRGHTYSEIRRGMEELSLNTEETDG